ncbi:MAG: chaperone modulator CbpM [Pseudomonadota bacterium]
MTDESSAATGLLLDETVTLTLVELCRAGNIHPEYVIEMIDEGVLEPQGTSPRDWCFDATALKRLQAAIHLQRDLRVNLAGAALALDLLEEIEALRKRLNAKYP